MRNILLSFSVFIATQNIGLASATICEDGLEEEKSIYPTKKQVFDCLVLKEMLPNELAKVCIAYSHCEELFLQNLGYYLRMQFPSYIRADRDLQIQMIDFYYERGMYERMPWNLLDGLPNLEQDALTNFKMAWVYIRLKQQTNRAIPHVLINTVKSWAAEDDAARQYVLGWLYNFGWKTPEGEEHQNDIKIAIQFYTKAAEGGSPEAQWALGLIYHGRVDIGDAWGQKHNQEEAKKWLTAASKNGKKAATRTLKNYYPDP